MKPTDTTEKGLETLIVAALTGQAPGTANLGEARAGYGDRGYVQGDPKDYDRDHAVDRAKLLAFLRSTQPDSFDQLGLANDGPARLKFLARLQGEVAKRGVVDVLRSGIKHGSATVGLFYGTPRDAGVIAPFDPESGTRAMKYVPWWAAPHKAE